MNTDTLIQILQNGIDSLQSANLTQQDEVKTMMVMSGLLRDHAQRIQQTIQQKMVDRTVD